MVARLASLAILLLPLAIGVPCAVGAPQAHLGDFSSTFAAEYGQPIGSQQLKAVHVLSYQGCPRATTPQRSVFFVQGVAIAVFVSPCGGPIPDDWRVRAKVFLPADSSFVSASPYQGGSSTSTKATCSRRRRQAPCAELAARPMAWPSCNRCKARIWPQLRAAYRPSPVPFPPPPSPRQSLGKQPPSSQRCRRGPYRPPRSSPPRRPRVNHSSTPGMSLAATVCGAPHPSKSSILSSIIKCGCTPRWA